MAPRRNKNDRSLASKNILRWLLENSANILSHDATGIRFLVEELERPTERLPELPLSAIWAQFFTQVQAHSLHPDTLLALGFHPFLQGMYRAYSEHRPFTLSPDMIWLLITQGFSRHVNFGKNTPDEVFPHLPWRQNIIIHSPLDSTWEERAQDFVDHIDEIVGRDLVEVLRADFSTTGPTERMVNALTILDTFKSYFEYIQNITICGIPEIHLEGRPEDWERMRDKLNRLRVYHLDWWVDQLDPLLDALLRTSRGDIDRSFWQRMFKIHSTEEYGHPQYIDGWILRFYPYDRWGQLNHFETKRLDVHDIPDKLPKEVVCVEFLLRQLGSTGELIAEIPMEYWAGFIGLRQDRSHLGLRPELGWVLGERRGSIVDQVPEERQSDSGSYFNLKHFPTEVLSQSWWSLRLYFVREIELPWSVLGLSVKQLYLNGKMCPSDHLKVMALRLKGVKVLIQS